MDSEDDLLIQGLNIPIHEVGQGPDTPRRIPNFERNFAFDSLSPGARFSERCNNLGGQPFNFRVDFLSLSE
ncbi:hypothetical protein AVEN_52335-1 [Araneus ventricosus]|uniref:Uncharacterized protein n=1 Tax=Araneus ventricosus TaxID=182803 RepID=A0A4Y2QGG0_ARAVE|nr:hypothetical protein AVEN_52335-1 [Araneus ventricosus]